MTTTRKSYVKHCLKTTLDVLGDRLNSHTAPLASAFKYTFDGRAHATFTSSRTIVDKPHDWSIKAAYHVDRAVFKCMKNTRRGRPFESHYKFKLAKTIFKNRHFLASLYRLFADIAIQLTFDDEFKKELDNAGPRLNQLKENVQADGFMVLVYYAHTKSPRDAYRWLRDLFQPLVDAIYFTRDKQNEMVPSISRRKLIRYKPARGLGLAIPKGAKSYSDTFQLHIVHTSTSNLPLRDIYVPQTSN